MPAHAQTRYAAGLEKMSIYGIEATFGEVAKTEWAHAWTNGTNSAITSSCRTTKSCATASSCATRSGSNDVMRPRATQGDARQPALLDQALVRPDELSDTGKSGARLKRRTTACWRGSSSTRRRVAYKTGDFPKAAEKFKEGLDALEDRA